MMTIDAKVVRQYEPADSEGRGVSGLAVLEHEGHTYELDYSDSRGLSVLRGGEFPGARRPGWCGVNYDHKDRIRPGYYAPGGEWVDVAATEADIEVRRWASQNYRSLFGLGATPGRGEDRTPYHKPEGVQG
jgi:hypothetical protein